MCNIALEAHTLNISRAAQILSTSQVWDLLQRTFVQRALLVAVLVSLCTALLGVNLVLKRYAMIGDGLSHVAFGTLSVAFAMGWSPLYVALPMVLAAAFLLLRLSESSHIKGDAAIALISSASLAVGVIAVDRAGGFNPEVQGYLFGSLIGSITREDVMLTIAVTVLVLAVYVVCYHKFFAVTFDESFARATGTRTRVYNTLLALLTALVIVIGMRTAGAMLISSFIVFPALTAMRLLRSFRGVVLGAVASAVLGAVIGVVASLFLDTPTGATIVVVNLLLFLLASGVRKIRLR